MKDKRTCITMILINILLPLLIGTAVYPILNPCTYIGELMGHLPFVSGSGRFLEAAVGRAGVFIRNYAADMAWAYAFAFSICLITGSEKKVQRRCLVICVMIEFLLELAQYVHIISGYFDWMDLVLEMVMNVCAYIIWSYKMRQAVGKIF